MKRLPAFVALFAAALILAGANGCSSDPNVEGAKLDLRNKDYDRALENLDKALEKDPDNVEALTMKGDALLEKAFMSTDPAEHRGFIEQMLAAYNRAAGLQADVSHNLDIAYVREFERAVQAFNAGQNDEAMYAASAEYFETTATIRPDSAAPYTYQGYALLNGGDSDAAIRALETGIEKGETDLQAFLYLSELYSAAERSDEAVTLMERAEQLHPDDPDVQVHLLNAYQQAGMLDRAMTRYQSSIEREPDNQTFRYNYGSLLLQSGDYDGAIVHLSRATELDPEYGFAWYNLGAAYQNKAVAFNEQVTVLDDSLRESRATMSPERIREIEGQIDALVEQRKASFTQAIGPLENARRIIEAEAGDTTGICVALYTAYVQTDQLDKAQTVSSCAGFDE